MPQRNPPEEASALLKADTGPQQVEPRYQCALCGAPLYRPRFWLCDKCQKDWDLIGVRYKDYPHWIKDLCNEEWQRRRSVQEGLYAETRVGYEPFWEIPGFLRRAPYQDEALNRIYRRSCGIRSGRVRDRRQFISYEKMEGYVETLGDYIDDWKHGRNLMEMQGITLGDMRSLLAGMDVAFGDIQGLALGLEASEGLKTRS